MNLLIAGGTGLVGRAFITQANQLPITLTTVGRRVTGNAPNELVVDFAALPTPPFGTLKDTPFNTKIT